MSSHKTGLVRWSSSEAGTENPAWANDRALVGGAMDTVDVQS